MKKLRHREDQVTSGQTFAATFLQHILLYKTWAVPSAGLGAGRPPQTELGSHSPYLDFPCTSPRPFRSWGTADLKRFCLTRTSTGRAGRPGGKSQQSPGVWGPLCSEGSPPAHSLHQTNYWSTRDAGLDSCSMSIPRAEILIGMIYEFLREGNGSRTFP